MNSETLAAAPVRDAPLQAGDWYALRSSVLPCALRSIFDVLGVDAGDRVIMPVYARRGLAQALAAAGLLVDLADVDDTLTLDAADLERRIQPRTRVVVVHHAAGAPADMGRLVGAARQRGAVVVEDISEASGATLDGRDVGSFGDLALRERGSDVEVASGLGAVSTRLALLSDRPGTARHPAREGTEAAARRLRWHRALEQIGAALPVATSWRPLRDPEGDGGGHLIAFFTDASASRLAAERLTAEGVTASLVFSPEHGRDRVAYFWASDEESPWPPAGAAMDPGEFAHSWALLSRAVRLEVGADLCRQAPDALARRISAALRSLT